MHFILAGWKAHGQLHITKATFFAKYYDRSTEVVLPEICQSQHVRMTGWGNLHLNIILKVCISHQYLRTIR